VEAAPVVGGEARGAREDLERADDVEHLRVGEGDHGDVVRGTAWHELILRECADGSNDNEATLPAMNFSVEAVL